MITISDTSLDVDNEDRTLCETCLIHQYPNFITKFVHPMPHGSCPCGFTYYPHTTTAEALMATNVSVAVILPHPDYQPISFPAFLNKIHATPDTNIIFPSVVNGIPTELLWEDLRKLLLANQSKDTGIICHPEGSVAWNPKNYNIDVNRFLAFFKQLFPVAHQLFPRSNSWSRVRAKPSELTTILHDLVGFLNNIGCKGNLGGSPPHLDVSSTGQTRCFSDAVGVLLQGTKYFMIQPRQHPLTPFLNWTSTRLQNSAILSKKSSTAYNTLVKGGYIPDSFKNVNHFGWFYPADILENPDLGLHFHPVKAGSTYFIRRGTVHCVINDVGTTSSIAWDDFYDTRSSNKFSLCDSVHPPAGRKKGRK